MRERVQLDSQSFAVMSGAYVVSSCGVVDDAMITKLGLSGRDEEILRNPAYTGGSVIVNPDAQVIAGPLGNEEGILYGECDFSITVRAKLRQDFSGHYNRPDIFKVVVNREAPAPRGDLAVQGMPVAPVNPLAPIDDATA